MFTIDEIQKQTGLQIYFIRKCLKVLNDILSPHIQRGEHNSLLFNDNALVIFDQIKQLKEQGLSIVEIEKQLQTIKTETSDVPKQSTNSEILELHRQILKDRENYHQGQLEYGRRLAELERKNLVLENSLKVADI